MFNSLVRVYFREEFVFKFTSIINDNLIASNIVTVYFSEMYIFDSINYFIRKGMQNM